MPFASDTFSSLRAGCRIRKTIMRKNSYWLEGERAVRKSACMLRPEHFGHKHQKSEIPGLWLAKRRLLRTIRVDRTAIGSLAVRKEEPSAVTSPDTGFVAATIRGKLHLFLFLFSAPKSFGAHIRFRKRRRTRHYLATDSTGIKEVRKPRGIVTARGSPNRKGRASGLASPPDVPKIRF